MLTFKGKKKGIWSFFSDKQWFIIAEESLEFYQFFTFVFSRTFLWPINPASNVTATCSHSPETLGTSLVHPDAP